MNTPKLNDNSEIDIITSHEKNVSEIKTPKTISDDSINCSKKEKNENKNIKVQKKSIEYNNETFNPKFICNSNNINSTKNINIKLRLNDKNFIAFIPTSKKNITVKKKQILNLCDNNKNILDNSDKKNSENKYNQNMSKSKNEEKEPIQELKKNLSHHSIKFCLNQKLSKLKNKNKLKKVPWKIPINNNLIKKIKTTNDNINKNLNENKNKNEVININLINIDSNKEKNKNKKINKDNIVFKINDKLAKNIDISNTSINNNIKLIKENNSNEGRNSNLKKNSDIYYFKKSTNITTTKNNNSNLALSIDNSNILVNNCIKLPNNMSGKNIIYAPKRGIKRLRSHEKKLNNIYNNMSHQPNQIKENSKNKNNLKFIHKKEANSEVNHFLEKNNSFCGALDSYRQIMIENENSISSPRINLRNNIPRIKYNIINNEINNNRIGNNNIFNYFNKTSEQILEENNNAFIPNRLTTSEKVNYNNFSHNKNFGGSLNLGLNLNTDFNDYNISNMNNNLNNIINNRALINKMNIFPQGYNFAIISPFNNNINQTNLINLFNNNYLNFNTIQGRQSSLLNNVNIHMNNDLLNQYSTGNIKINNIKQNPSINIEDIIILQEKMKYIILSLDKNNFMANECFEFLNFYYNSSIYCQLEKSFKNPSEANIVRISINCTLISVIICYDYSFEKEILNQMYIILLDIMKLNFKNLIIIYDHILSKISSESRNNIWVKKLSNIISSYKKIESIKINNLTKIATLNYNTSIIFNNLIFVLKNYKTYRNDYLINFINNIIDKTYYQINIFFREFILRTNNLNGSILASVYLRNGNKNFVPIPNPYVRTKNNKNYSLVLDLDETLVHFKEKINEEGNGILRIRPGLNEFLEEVGKYYELIVFTTATQDYADTLIDAIEEDKIYFEHRFYRNHAIIINNDFVKDLNRIGRPLDKIIIIDNMPQNFRLQKENGIMIKPFWGEDNYDTALFDLIPILINIAKEGGDVRVGLEKYKDDILKKISSNISKEIT
mgnify:CR=1 FL=1